MQYVMVTVVIAGLSLIYGQIWLRRRRQTPLRREIRARDIPGVTWTIPATEA